MLIIFGIIVLLLCYVLITLNSLIRLDNKVKEAFSTMDVYLKKRWDLIPNLVEMVKGYTKHEKSSLEEIIRLRNSSYDMMTKDNKLDINSKISQDINKIMLIVENYPVLKSNDSFINLSKSLTKIEEDIANSRKYYNGIVRIYNNKVQMVPSNIISKIFGYKVQTMFEAKEDERNSVRVEL